MSAEAIRRLPQTGPARLVIRVLHTGADAACVARIPADSPFRKRDGEHSFVPALLAIEMAAQSAAALEPVPDQPPSGSAEQRYLVGVRAVRLHVDRLDADQEYVCRATPLTIAPPLRIYRFEVSGPTGERLAEGELSTFCGEG